MPKLASFDSTAWVTRLDVAHINVNRHLGMALMKIRQHFIKGRKDDMACQMDAQMPGQLLLALGHQLAQPPDRTADFLCLAIEHRAVFGNLEPSGPPLDQLFAKLFLKPLQGIGHRRLAQQQPVCGAGDRPLLHNHGKGMKQVPVELTASDDLADRVRRRTTGQRIFTPGFLGHGFWLGHRLRHLTRS